MGCSGCQKRREWIKKWTQIAKERARQAVRRLKSQKGYKYGSERATNNKG